MEHEREQREERLPPDPSEPWTCQDDPHLEGSPCWSLLKDPLHVLTDKTRWPRHLCGDMLHESTERWLIQEFWMCSLVQFLSREFPVPLGEQSLTRELEYGGETDLLTSEALSLMPFKGDVYATLIIQLNIRETDITGFGLSTIELFDEPGDRIFHPADIAFRVLGNPADPEVLNVIRHARAWWKRFGWVALARGRPAGTAHRQLNDYLAAYRQFVEQHRDRPTMEQFVVWSGIPRSTVKRQLRSWGISWASFRSWDLQSPFST